MKRALIVLGIVALGFAIWLAMRSGTFYRTAPPIDGVSQATERRYGAVEIRDYQGVRLDPSVGPRDNSIKGVQNINLEGYSLKVSGLVDQSRDYTYEDVLDREHHQRLITLFCVEGWDATILWKGVKLMDLLNAAGVKATANTVIFHCADGYTTSLPLDTIRERDMLLAFASNEITLPKSLGFPFIVVAQDKLGYKWARWVVGMEVSDDLQYKGYWERRGYSNDAEVDK